jgi:hypothetical protein
VATDRGDGAGDLAVDHERITHCGIRRHVHPAELTRRPSTVTSTLREPKRMLTAEQKYDL